MIWALICAAGALTGLRCFVPIAVLTMFAVHRTIPFDGTPFAWLGHGWVHVLIVLAALGEIVGDKLPHTPARTRALGLNGRFLVGGALGAALGVHANVPWIAAAALAAVSAIGGAFAGWFVRTRAVALLRCPDWPVAVAEDVFTIACSFLVLSRVAAL